MPWQSIPEARRNLNLAFNDASSARTWLAAQVPTPALTMLMALNQQIEALDAANLAPELSIELLNMLRTAALPALEKIESRFTRKALPMPAEDQGCFEIAEQFWRQLGIAYLRQATFLPAAAKALPLNRAACAFRIAEYCHFQAASECPTLLDRLLFAVLAEGQKEGLLQHPLADPDFPHLGETHIAGHLAWAFLLRLIDPYRLSGNELMVANRAISRWRELCSFQFEIEVNPKAQAVDLTRLFGGPLPAILPRWLNVRALARKANQRIEALQEGQSPESLKLGKELSPAACLRLLKALIASLRPSPASSAGMENGEITLSFGSENAYAILRGKRLNPPASLGSQSASLAHQRMAMFGFDRHSQMPTAVKALNIPGETWRMVDGKAIRQVEPLGNRHLSPCLVASALLGVPRLGVMLGLQRNTGGTLRADLSWYKELIEVGQLTMFAGPDKHLPAIPAFLLHDEETLSLIVPATAGLRLYLVQALKGMTVSHVAPTEVLERGVDFIRYAVKKQ